MLAVYPQFGSLYEVKFTVHHGCNAIELLYTSKSQGGFTSGLVSSSFSGKLVMMIGLPNGRFHFHSVRIYVSE